MATIWTQFGFTETPYRATPLGANAEDLKLFTERDRGEGSAFLTAVDCSNGCVVVVSGDIGIGKTSFVNIQQHLLATGSAPSGPRLLPCQEMTPFMLQDTPTTLSQRIVHNTLVNVELYCSEHKIKLPPECETVRKWLSYRPTTSGYQISLGALGIGRSIYLPPVSDATLETWRDILKAIAAEVRAKLGVDGFVICLDNAETLTHNHLATLLMAYRDIMFSISGIWWILIGQSQLYKEIEFIDRRVSQRISGNGVELSHLTLREFHDVIDRRVKVYRHRPDALSPLSQEMHEILFRAACGEVRFVLDTANILVQQIIVTIRETAKANLQGMASPAVVEKTIHDGVAKVLIDRQIPDKLATRILKSMTKQFVDELLKEEGVVEKLELIGCESVQKDDYQRFGCESAEDFLNGFLEPLRTKGALCREAGANTHTYRLKGFAALAKEFEILSQRS